MSLESLFWMNYIPVSQENLEMEFLNLDATYFSCWGMRMVPEVEIVVSKF